MAVTETSRKSYRKLNDLGNRQREVHKAIGELGTASNREIAKYLDKPVNEITPRVKELREYGFVAEHGKKWDKETNRNVIAWCVVDPYAQKVIDLIRDPADDIEPEKWQPSAVGWLND